MHRSPHETEADHQEEPEIDYVKLTHEFCGSFYNYITYQDYSKVEYINKQLIDETNKHIIVFL